MAPTLVRVADAPGLLAGEEVRLSGGAVGVVRALLRDEAWVEILDPAPAASAGEVVVGTGRLLGVVTGDGLAGRLLDPLGRPLDGGPVVEGPRVPLRPRPLGIPEAHATGGMLWTGSTQVDLLLGLRRGTATALLGVRGSGRSTLARDAVFTQVRAGARCVIAACGHEVGRVAVARASLDAVGALRGTTWVTARAGAPALARRVPAAALAVAEAWVDAGEDVLLVLDGVDAYVPWGEVAARASARRSGGSLSVLVLPEGALPVDAPIDRSVVLDGHTRRLDLVASEVRASRHGRPLQGWGYKLALPLLAALEVRRVCEDPGLLDDESRRVLERADRLWEALTQPPGAPVPVEEQVVTVFGVLCGARMSREEVLAGVRRVAPGLLDEIRVAEGLLGALRARLAGVLEVLGVGRG